MSLLRKLPDRLGRDLARKTRALCDRGLPVGAGLLAGRVHEHSHGAGNPTAAPAPGKPDVVGPSDRQQSGDLANCLPLIGRKRTISAIDKQRESL